jgi:hypothetical protein
MLCCIIFIISLQHTLYIDIFIISLQHSLHIDILYIKSLQRVSGYRPSPGIVHVPLTYLLFSPDGGRKAETCCKLLTYSLVYLYADCVDGRRKNIFKNGVALVR